MANSNDTGLRIREVRKMLGLTQRELGDILGLSQAAIGKTEQGFNLMKRSNLNKLEEKYDVSIEYIKKGTGEPFLKRELKENYNPPVMLISRKALINVTKGIDIKDEEIKDILHIPLNSTKTHYAIESKVNNKEDYIKESSILIIEEMDDISSFINNKLYVIIFNNSPFVKRMQMILGGVNKNKFRAKSGEEYQDEEIVEEKDITAWYKVTHVLNQI